MKKTYIKPQIETEELASEEMLQNLSMIQSTDAQGPALSKERETVDFSKDMDF